MLRPTRPDNLRCLALQTVANHLQIPLPPLYATLFASHKSCIFCKTRTLVSAFRCKYRTSVLPSRFVSAACALCTEKEGGRGCSAIMVNHNSRFGTDLKVGHYNGQPCGHGVQQCCAPTRAHLSVGAGAFHQGAIFHRELANADAGGSEDGIRYSWGYGRDAGFAGAAEGRVAFVEVDVDGGGTFGEVHHVVVREIFLDHGTFVDGDFAEEDGAEPEHHGALHLRFEAVGIDSVGAVDCCCEAVNFDRAATGDLDFGDVGDDGAEALGDSDTAAAARRKRRAPASFLGSQVKGREVARLVLQQRAAILERIALGLLRQLVNERFDEEAMPGSFDAAPSPGGHVSFDFGHAVGLIRHAVENPGFVIDGAVGSVVVNPSGGQAVLI